eukprot:9052435-Pyramimonas_sp.AAC.1
MDRHFPLDYFISPDNTLAAEGIYHRNMVMEDTDCGSGTFKVLSSDGGGLIRLQAHNPNLDTILRG